MSVFVNRVPNPSAEGATPSLENGVGATVTMVTTTASDWPPDGTHSYSVVATATTFATARLRLVDRAATVAAKRWHLRAKIRAFSSNVAQRTYTARGVSYNIAPGATAGTATQSSPTSVVLSPGESADLSMSFDTAAGALSAGFELSRSTGAIGDGFHVDMIAFVQDDDVDAPVVYFNPDTNGLAVWDGATNASTSTLYVPETLLELLLPEDGAPQPGVRATVSDLPPWADNVVMSVTVDNEDEDEPTRFVRNANGESALATFIVEDYEVALGITSSYAVEARDGDVRLGFAVPADIVVPYDDPLDIWIADPLDPASAVRGTVSANFADEMGRDRDADFSVPGGAQDGAVILAGSPQGYTGINLEFYSADAATTRAFKRLIKQTPIAVVRTVAPVPVPRTLYVALLNPRSRLLIEQTKLTRWSWTSRQLLSPTIGVVVPLHTYADYIAFYPTYDAAMAVFLDYVDAIRNPPPEA